MRGRNLAINGVSASSGKRRLNLAASESCRSLRQRRRCCTFHGARSTLSFSTRRDLSLNSILMVRVCLAFFCCGVTVASALAQTNSQFPVPTNVPEAASTPQTSPLIKPESLFSTPAPLLSPTPIPTPFPSPTPLPDGTMPLPLPVMPTPVLQDANTLSEELNRPIPAPSQFSEPLMKPAEWRYSPAIALPSPIPVPTLSPALTPTQSPQ